MDGPGHTVRTAGGGFGGGERTTSSEQVIEFDEMVKSINDAVEEKSPAE